MGIGLYKLIRAYFKKYNRVYFVCSKISFSYSVDTSEQSSVEKYNISVHLYAVKLVLVNSVDTSEQSSVENYYINFILFTITILLTEYSFSKYFQVPFNLSYLRNTGQVFNKINLQYYFYNILYSVWTSIYRPLESFLRISRRKWFSFLNCTLF